MPHIGKPDLNAFTDPDPLAILTWHKKFNRVQCILHYINRLILRLSCTLSLPVSPFSLKLLDMCTVTQHDITQVSRCIRGKDLTFKSIFCKSWQHPRMIYMCMRQEHIIHFIRRNRKPRILIQIRSLLHSTINQNIFPCSLKEMTAPSNFVGCSYKSKFHKSTNPSAFSFIVALLYLICTKNIAALFKF